MANYSPYTDVASATTWTEGEALIRDGNTVAWYDFSDASTITKDGSNLVSAWNDKLAGGINLAATGAAKPLAQATGILFDGTAQYMQAGPFDAVSMPLTGYLIVKQVSWTIGDILCQYYNINQGIIKQVTSSPYIIQNIDWYSDTLAVGSFGIIQSHMLAANSFGRINNSAAITGTQRSYTGTLSYLAIGSLTGGITPANIEVKGWVIRKVDDDATNETKIYNYLKAYYSI